MASIDDSQVTDYAAQPAIEPAQPEIADLLGIARRGWLFIVGGTTFGIICALVILSYIPPLYKASSRIVFERTLPRYLQTNKVTNEPVIEDYDTLGQSYVISSESVLLRVVRSLSLASDPDFVGNENSETLSSRLRGLFRNAAQALGFPKKLAEESVDQRGDPEMVAFDSLVRNLTVSREEVQSVITIAFSSKDPVKAATIVNAIVDTYMDANVSDKMKSTKVADKVVQERIEELKRQVADADSAVAEFKTLNKLVGSDEKGLSHGQLHDLQQSMTNAQLAMAEAKVRMDRISSAPDAIALFAPDNELISKMRGELLELSVRANDIERRVGKDHLAAVKVRTRMEEVREAIANEQRRIAGSFSKDYDLARARYDELFETVSRVISEDGSNNDIQGQLRGLQNAASTLRALYTRMLQQASETNRVEAQPSVTPDARVLMRATPPLQTEASKKRLLIIGGSSVMGLLLGVGIVFARNFPFGVFRTSQQVTNATGLPCIVLPRIARAEEQASLMSGEYALDWPYSRFAQTLRSIWAKISIAQRESGAKVVCVVSSNPGEGKTTIAINLAAQLARRSTTRVLLIDADFYRQSLTQRVAPEARAGLREALEEPRAFAKFVVRKERLNLDALPCPAPDRIPNAAELLETVEMEQLIGVAREAYDLVIIEAPPVGAVVDYKMIERHCDRFVFVVEWGKTSQRLVLECLSDASTLLDRVLCVALNKADLSALRSIEYYKGDGFHGYYSDQRRA
jgi:polysaccharide biosynthesis transport protein